MFNDSTQPTTRGTLLKSLKDFWNNAVRNKKFESGLKELLSVDFSLQSQRWAWLNPSMNENLKVLIENDPKSLVHEFVVNFNISIVILSNYLKVIKTNAE